ncbi:MAG: preprotein translocase subunit YajC [Bernardetiaceae bacterium]|nr:preprotein translocase subunit YajC [Bernardetiaceae bacterium]
MNYLILLQADGGGFDPMTIILFGGMFLVLYFFMIRPQQKKQKEQQKFIEALRKGDRVVTVGGVHGEIIDLKEDVITLEVDRGVRIKVNRNFVSYEFSSPDPKAKDKKEDKQVEA